MNKVKVFGRRGSAYKNTIDEVLGKNKIVTSHLAVNYGLQGDKLEAYIRRNPQIARIPVLNFKQAGNKYDQIKTVEGIGERVPKSYHNHQDIPRDQIRDGGFILKPYYSLGGKNIEPLTLENLEEDKDRYVQERIHNRRYEIRVHAFAWVDPENWVFQKRVHEEGEDILAWNHHNGGRFITIDDPHDPLHDRIRESVKKIMKVLGYQFGGVDFIIQNPGKKGQPLCHYFIEWNLAPGWTLDRTENYYKESFLMLQEIDINIISGMVDGIYPWEIEQEDEEVPPPMGARAEAPPRRAFEELVIEVEQGEDDGVVGEEDFDPARYHENPIDPAEEILRDLQMHVRRAEMEQQVHALRNFIQAPNRPAPEYCHNCGAKVNEEIFGNIPKFCPLCGQKVRD